jgi:hypothetical protein
MIESIESHYRYVKNAIITLNTARTVVGILEAMDWPPKEIQLNAFYVLSLGETPAENVKQIYSTGMLHLIQWTWIIAGSDLNSTQRGRNKGDRFRINFAMKSELIQALSPYFTERKKWSAKQVGNVIQYTGTSYDPPEKCFWTRPKFLPPKLEGSSGVIYGAAQLYIADFGDTIEG